MFGIRNSYLQRRSSTLSKTTVWILGYRKNSPSRQRWIGCPCRNPCQTLFSLFFSVQIFFGECSRPTAISFFDELDGEQPSIRSKALVMWQGVQSCEYTRWNIIHEAVNMKRILTATIHWNTTMEQGFLAMGFLSFKSWSAHVQRERTQREYFDLTRRSGWQRGGMKPCIASLN